MVMDDIYQRIITNCKQINKSISNTLSIIFSFLMDVFVLIFCYFDKVSEAVNLKVVTIIETPSWPVEYSSPVWEAYILKVWHFLKTFLFYTIVKCANKS